MADLRDVLAGHLVIADQLPTEGECGDDPLIVDLDDHKYNGQIGFLPRHYLRYPLVGGVPHMAEVEKVARFASGILVNGVKVIFVSLHPVPRAMCAARALHLSVGGTIQGAIMAVNKADETPFADDRVLDVMILLGGGAK